MMRRGRQEASQSVCFQACYVTTFVFELLRVVGAEHGLNQAGAHQLCRLCRHNPCSGKVPKW